MDITLPAKLDNFVRAQVRSGRYVDPEEVVRDAVRRMQEAEAPDSPAGLVREAITLVSQTQRDVLSLVQRADRETDVFHQLLGAASAAVDASLDTARRIPVAREVERVVRGSLEQVTSAAEHGEREARQLRQGLEGTARALGALASVLERVNSTTAALNKVGAPPKSA
jgi:putative addiction module CopG family antidote